MDINKEEITVHHNEAMSQFEVNIHGNKAVAEYRRVKDKIIFTHTEVPDEMEGQGVGSKLAKTALNYARDNDLVVMPICPFIAAYIKRHQEYMPLVLPGFFR